MVKKGIRHKLLMMNIYSLVVPFTIALIVGGWILREQIMNQAQQRMKADLNLISEMLNSEIHHNQDVLQIIASQPASMHSLKKAGAALQDGTFDSLINLTQFDWLLIIDRHGTCIAAADRPEASGVDIREDFMVRVCLQNQLSVSGLSLCEDKLFRRFARKKSVMAATMYEPNRNMVVIESVIPVLGFNKKFSGAICGLKVLNGNDRFVSRMKEILLSDIDRPGTEPGFIELYTFSGCMASSIPSRIGQPFPESTLYHMNQDEFNDSDQPILYKTRWKGQSFSTTTHPLYDFRGQNIGIIALGILEQPFMNQLKIPFFIFLSFALLSLLLIILVARRNASYITKPIIEMSETANNIASGNYDQRLKVTSSDELGELAVSFNYMTDQLKELFSNLELKVMERTARIEKMQRQLILSDRLASTGQLAAGVAHEINNPLTSILTNASLLADRYPEGDECRQDLDIIVSETLRCRKIIRGLLNFSRQSAPETRMVCMNNIVNTTFKLVNHQLEKKEITLRLDLSDNLPETCMDPDQIQQVILNLIMNATDAMPAGGNLTITTISSSDRVTLKITDEGSGIPETYIDQIFNPFFTTKQEGTGLGLSISFGIIEQHGGSIKVNSEVDRGTTFIISIPLLKGDEDDPA